MRVILFYLTTGILNLLALLPLSVLYVFADFIGWLLFYIFPYRKAIVYENLVKSFPSKSQDEVKQIMRRFYSHFADLLVETLKLLRFSPAELSRHIYYENPEILNRLHSEGRHAIVLTGHLGNWEWLLGLTSASPYHTMSVYKPLSDKRFDRFFTRIRSKFGTTMVTMRSTIREILQYQKDQRLTLSCFIADQSPVWEETQYWTTFMNQQTAVYLGFEKIARKTNQVVLFYQVRKVKRGRYSVRIIPITENSQEMQPYEITEKYLQTLESVIREYPASWLWSHNRWKLTKNKEYLMQTKGPNKNVKFN
jgi:KDO2-lipid IV(A) lauroyltransferase